MKRGISEITNGRSLRGIDLKVQTFSPFHSNNFIVDSEFVEFVAVKYLFNMLKCLSVD